MPFLPLFPARLLVAIPALALCVACTPTSMETPPVSVETSKGTVICQLYTKNRVYWDRAISVPSGMTPDQADDVCRSKGFELMNGPNNAP
jgi:hypothetical protein